VYGPRDTGRVIPHWIELARERKELIVYGGQQIIDFIWVGDVVQAMLRAAAADVSLPPINVASGTGTKISDLARRISRLADSHAETRIVPRRSIEVMRFIGSTDRMTQLLGVSPAADPLSHLPEMVHTLASAAA
jgi:UDP-glucose 4-epimerase